MKLMTDITFAIRRRYLLLALVLYLLFYGYLRQNHVLVHTVSHSKPEHGSVIFDHGVRSGDFGVPIFHPMFSLVVALNGLIYMPLLPYEIVYWHIVQPVHTCYYDAELKKVLPIEERPVP
jgi:hypothetical protein